MSVTDNEVQLLWPATLILPPAIPTTVYLDMNHWIYLAKAAKGLSTGSRYASALAACRAARSAGTAVFPLSATHYMELAKVKDPAQRRDLADLMEELSGFATLLDRQTVIKHEIEALLDHRLGPAEHAVAEYPVLGSGVGHAFGKHMRFRIGTVDGGELPQQLLDGTGAADLDAFLAAANLFAERKMLQGPEDAELPSLARYGFVHDVAEQVAQRRADQENDQAARHAGTAWARSSKLADVVNVRELNIELFDLVMEALQLRGITEIDVLIPNKPAARSLIPSMPVSSVAATLKIEQHRNPNRPWISNDVFDIDALSGAVPYCDIVVTDKGRWHHLRATKTAARMNTVVLRQLEDLIQHL